MPVKDLLQPGSNRLSVRISPAIPAIAAAAVSYPYELPSIAAPGAFGGWMHLRKPALDFGWDWGPAYAPSGIHVRPPTTWA